MNEELINDNVSRINKEKTILDNLLDDRYIIKLGEDKYINTEGWMILAKYYGISTIIENVEIFTIGAATGSTKGMLAKGSIVKDGVKISSAVGICTENDEASLNMQVMVRVAQDRAIVRAIINELGWFAILNNIALISAEEKNSVNVQKPTQVSQSNPATSTNKELTQEHKKLLSMLSVYCNKDQEQMKEILSNLTKWTDKEGKYHAGKTSLIALSEKQAKVAIDKLAKLAQQPVENANGAEPF